MRVVLITGGNPVHMFQCSQILKETGHTVRLVETVGAAYWVYMVVSQKEKWHIDIVVVHQSLGDTAVDELLAKARDVKVNVLLIQGEAPVKEATKNMGHVKVVSEPDGAAISRAIAYFETYV